MLGFEHRVCDSKSLGYIILPSENKPLGKKWLSLSHLQRSVQSGVHDTKRGLIVFYHGLLGQPSSLAGVSPVLQAWREDLVLCLLKVGEPRHPSWRFRTETPGTYRPQASSYPTSLQYPRVPSWKPLSAYKFIPNVDHSIFIESSCSTELN